jgi:FAD-dependent urate hydroxylase
VAGLHFAGAPAAWSLGPLMRFVSGTWYASRQIAGRIATERRP